MTHGNSIPVGDIFVYAPAPCTPAPYIGYGGKTGRDVDSNVGPRLRMCGAISPSPIRWEIRIRIRKVPGRDPQVACRDRFFVIFLSPDRIPVLLR